MKKNKLVLSTLTIALGTTLIAPNALADSKGSTTSKGEAGFTAPDQVDNDIQIPEVDPEVTIRPPYNRGENEIQSGNGLALFVPDFIFGTKEVKQEEQKFDVKPVKYTNTDSTATVQDYYLPPMVIVKDMRGGNGKWSVKAKASNFKNSANEELKGAKMVINDTLLFNNLKAASGALPSLSDQNVTGDTTNFKIYNGSSTFTFNETADMFLGSEGEHGNGQTTLVPETQTNYNDFKATAASKSKYSATDTIPSVQLVVPAASARSTTSLYTSTITWELFDTADGK